MSRRRIGRLLARRRKNLLKPARAAARKAIYSKLASAMIIPLMSRKYPARIFTVTCLDCGLEPEEGLEAGCPTCLIVDVMLS